jgi:hypothetical protein
MLKNETSIETNSKTNTFDIKEETSTLKINTNKEDILDTEDISNEEESSNSPTGIVGIVIAIIIVSFGLCIGGTLLTTASNINSAQNTSLSSSTSSIKILEVFSSVASILPILILAALGGLATVFLMNGIGRIN